MFQIVWYAVSVFLVFTVTLSVFPAVISQVVSASPHHSGWTGMCPVYVCSHSIAISAGSYFSALVCFLMFNVSDLTGRYITHFIQVY